MRRLALAAAALALVAASARAAGPSYGAEPAATPSPLEARVLAAVRARLSPPTRVSAALVVAARELAARAAKGERDPIGRPSLRAALARAAAPDPAPAAVLVAADEDDAPAAVARALTRSSATHLGVGAVLRDGQAFVVLLASERRVRLSPFPRDVAAGGRARLAGTLAAPLGKARVFVTRPSGEVVEAGGGGRSFDVGLDFPAGRSVVEVVAEADAGPEVVALLTVAAGGASLDAGPRPPASPEPAERDESEAGVLRALNATRGRHGLPPLAASAPIAAVARRHAEAMATARRVAHVLPGSPDAAERLRRAGVSYRRAYENVARAETALEAHTVAEESPAHLANVLRGGASLAGIGIARVRLPTGGEAVYLSEVLVQPPDDGASSRLTPDARVREALWRERARLGLTPLVADPALDALAREAAAQMRARDETDPGPLADRALGLRRSLAAVDVFVATGVDEAARSANLKDGRFGRVGVGLASGDSVRFGKGRLWIAVIYTD